MRAWVIGLLLSACYRAPAPVHPIEAQPLEAVAEARVVETQTEVQPSALVAVPPRQARAVIASDKQTVFVAGCNVGCVDCGLGSYQTFVVGTLTRTGAKLFPDRDPPSPGYACSAQVAVGERVTLRAHSPVEKMTIVSWAPFFGGDACPCAGSTAQTCTFEVTPEIASRFDRVYCGATWKQHATAQIGH
jgi:hypothetical protein